ncbi:MAG: hypothetical protein GX913_05195 [Clostridiales bacterium]|nr:hypothetical protein [Clostridiales bacterium]
MRKLLGLAAAAVLAFSLTACGSASGDLAFGQVQYAAHGTKSFAVTSVVMNGDKVAIAHIDEFQVMDKASTVGVPNSDADFNLAFADQDTNLVSKRVNNDTYSANMKEKGGSTVSLVENYEAIETFAEGKTVAELEAAIDGKSATEVVDAVSGATLVDTTGYLESIIEAAKAAK